MTTGERIKALSDEKGFNTRQLAIKAGIPYNTVYAIVSRKSNRVQWSTLEALAEALDTNPSYLQGDTDNPSKDISDLALRFKYVAEVLNGMSEEELTKFVADNALNLKGYKAYKQALIGTNAVDLGLMALEIKKQQNCSDEEAEQVAEVIAKCIQSQTLSEVLILFDSASPELQQLVIAALKSEKK